MMSGNVLPELIYEGQKGKGKKHEGRKQRGFGARDEYVST
jgi:hypothetical protein